MPSLPRGQKHPPELRERAVRMVLEHQHEYSSQWKSIESIASKLDINRETLRVWVRRVETDAGQRPRLTTDERVRIRELERENKELRRANEVPKAASASRRTAKTAHVRSKIVAHGASGRIYPTPIGSSFGGNGGKNAAAESNGGNAILWHGFCEAYNYCWWTWSGSGSIAMRCDMFY